MINNLLSWSWNILQETLFSSGCVLQYSFYIGIFYLFEANRSQPKHFTASSSIEQKIYIRGHSLVQINGVGGSHLHSRQLVFAPISVRE